MIPTSNSTSYFSHYQAAADFAKARLPEALRQQLLAYEREKERDKDKDKEKDDKRERGGPSYPSILEQQILSVDREMLDKLSATSNEAGVCVICMYVYFNTHTERKSKRPQSDRFYSLCCSLLHRQ